MAALRCAAEKGDINELQKRLEAGMKGFSFLTHIVFKLSASSQYIKPELNVDFVKKRSWK